MGTDVLIHRCTLRVARRGGWSWGADPGALLAAAVQRLPELIAARLGECWPAEHDCELAAPLRLRMPLRLDELRAFAAQQGKGASTAAAPGSGLSLRIDAMVRAIVLREVGAGGVDQAAAVPPGQPPAAQAPDRDALWAGSVLSVLLDWRRQGVLQSNLLMFSPASLGSWHDSLLRAPGRPDAVASARASAALIVLATQFAGMALPLPTGRTAALVRRIGLMVSAAHDFGVSPADPALHAALAAHCGFELPPAAARVPARAEHARGAVTPADTQPEQAPAAAPVRANERVAASQPPVSRIDIEVASALPFLLLGPLSRTGYLRALGAVFEAGQLLPELACFAAALARKVLNAPQRGWFRSADMVTSAAAFAGRPTPPSDASIAELARRLAPLVSPLDALVANVLTAGHTRGGALLLQAAPLNGQAGWMLCDEEGLFPIAWAGRIERLYPRLAALACELLLVPESALSERLLDDLDDAGFRFVTDAQPARGQSWRALFNGPLRAWTNEHAAAPEPLSAAAARLEYAGAASAALWRGLAVERPGLPAGSSPEVERSLALAAALALGTLAWTLWHGREPVSPLLALQRFSDFGARVSIRPDRVQVHLPLGRRFIDLQRAGWLDDVADVPWLDGRPLLFAQA